MKRLSIALLAALLVLGTGTKAAGANPAPWANSAQGAANPTFAEITQLPAQLSFAGERVPLENRDTRESLIRELVTTSFMHSRTIMTLLNSTRYIPVIKPVMQQAGVPEDFIFLCMAEGGFDPEAQSGVGAAGLWQLMPTMAREYGLIVDKDIDERFDPEKSTDAACRFLKDAFAKLGTWTDAAASYNLGITGVATRLAQQGTTTYFDTFFPVETRRYVFRILSLKLLACDPVRYGFDIPSDRFFAPLPGYRVLEVAGEQIDWSAVARANGTTYKTLRELNPWIRTYEYKNTKGYKFNVKFPLAEAGR